MGSCGKPSIISAHVFTQAPGLLYNDWMHLNDNHGGPIILILSAMLWHTESNTAWAPSFSLMSYLNVSLVEYVQEQYTGIRGGSNNCVLPSQPGIML